MRNTAQEILSTIEQHRDTIKKFGVRRLGLFGSCARGDNKGTSDLDFLVELEHETFDAYMDLKAFLEDLFETEVDLVLPDAIKPRLRDTILGETIYARDFNLYLEDILESIESINEYISGLTFESFSKDRKTLDAVIRNLEIIGEASRNIPNEIRNAHPEIKWRGIIGLRNILIHEYYSLTLKIIWDIVQKELPILQKQIKQLLVKK